MSSVGTIEERVARGARLLDEMRPGWAAKINPRKLNIRNYTLCLLGQLFGDLEYGILGIAPIFHQDIIDFWEFTDEHAFSLPDNYEGCRDEGYEKLRTNWVVEIKSRLTPPPPAAQPDAREAIALITEHSSYAIDLPYTPSLACPIASLELAGSIR